MQRLLAPDCHASPKNVSSLARICKAGRGSVAAVATAVACGIGSTDAMFAPNSFRIRLSPMAVLPPLALGALAIGSIRLTEASSGFESNGVHRTTNGANGGIPSHTKQPNDR